MSDKKDKKPSLKEEFERAGQESALYERERALSLRKKQLEEAYGKDGSKSRVKSKEGWNNLSAKELQSEWENLRRFAKVNVPEGINEVSLSPDNKLVAVAHAQGWSYDKISKASGIAKSTVRNWLKLRPDVLLFVQKVEIAMGRHDVKPLLDKGSAYYLQYAVEELQKTPSNDAEHKRYNQLGQWVTELAHGKAKENTDVNITYGDLIAELGKQEDKEELSKKDEAKIFALADKK